MYSTGLLQHEGKIFGPDGLVSGGNSEILDCGHPRPAVEPGAFTVPWGIVHTPDGPEEYCVGCCEALEVSAIEQLPPGAAYSAYYDLKKRKIMTWHGTPLMRITYHNIYYHNFGGRFVAISAIDPHGFRWHGRASYDWGECINMHKSKVRS